MPALINLDLIKNPLNWAIITLMTIFGLALLAIIAPEPDAS